nr:MAG: coat protein [Wufeng shrew permutotetravirus 9]
MPALPPDATPENNMIFASAPNYFSDSSSDWKAGKYLTFKWHEGGNITSFPGGKTKAPYKCTSDVGYYLSNGTLAKTQWAVCVTETTEDGLPMLAPVAKEADAKAWCKNPADNLLLGYYAAGPWVTPENPPWFEKEATVDLLLSRTTCVQLPLFTPNATVCTSDASSEKMNRTLQKLIGKEKVTPMLIQALTNLAKLEFTGVGTFEALSTFNYDPARASTSHKAPEGASLTSSIEVIDQVDADSDTKSEIFSD